MRIKRLLVLSYCCFFLLVLSTQAQTVLDVLRPQASNLRSSAPNVIAAFSLDATTLATTYQRGLPHQLDWPLPTGKEFIIITLEEVQIWGPKMQVFNSLNRVENVDLGRHYQYNRRDTLIGLSIFEDRLIAQITIDNQSFTLGSVVNQPLSYGLVKAGSNRNLGTCSASDKLEASLIRKMQSLWPQQVETRNQLPPIDIYFELDHFLYQEQEESIEKSLGFFSSIFNNVQLLYAREGINVRVHSVKVWDQPDEFATISGGAAWRSFQNYIIDTQDNPSWDMALLVSRYSNENSTAPNGGLANVAGLCNNAKRQAYANISSTVEDFPDYSWPVFLISHEIGHTLGSPHTHNCNWPGGPLDNCYCPEGDCDNGPSVGDSGGTIMSYCFLSRPFNNSCPELPGGTNPGVNLLMGLGARPQALIHQTISEATCLDNKALADLPNLQSDTAAFLAQINDSLVIEGFQIWNNGTAETNPFSIQLSQGQWAFDDTLSTPDLWLEFPNLIPGDTLKLDTTLWWPTNSDNGQWTWILDPQQRVKEWHEGDNWQQQVLQQNLQFPQLSINTDFKLIDHTYFFTLDELRINNIGGAIADPIQIRYFLSLDEELDERDFWIGDNSHQWLPQKKIVSFPLTFFKPKLTVPAGTYHVISQIEVLGGNIPEAYPKSWTLVSKDKIQMDVPNFGWFRN